MNITVLVFTLSESLGGFQWAQEVNNEYLMQEATAFPPSTMSELFNIYSPPPLYAIQSIPLPW